MRVTILGSGHAAGTPNIDSGWDQCDPAEPRNRRLRPFILVESAETTLLVDTSPDLRAQLLNAAVGRLDGVLYTHTHADHLHGIDDLRAVNRAMDAWIDVYADASSWQVIEERFGYVVWPLDDAAKGFFYKPCLNRHEIAIGKQFRVGGFDILPFEQDHGRGKTLGFRIGAFAYSTDVVDLPDDAFTALAGVEVWVLGALGEAPHPTHAHVDKALAWIERVGPRRAVLTHMSNRLDYRTLAARLPAGVEAGYDGMIIEV